MSSGAGRVLAWLAGGLSMCAWMGAQLYGSRATRAGVGEVLALTISEQSVGFIRACLLPSTPSSHPADAGGAGWMARAATSEPTHPADQLRGIPVVNPVSDAAGRLEDRSQQLSPLTNVTMLTFVHTSGSAAPSFGLFSFVID